MKLHRVYMITNTVNGKLYIGKTKNTLEERWFGHKYCATHGSKYHLHSAIRVHGHEAFTITVLVDGISSEAASQEEIRYIAEFGSQDPERGYNMTPGGDGVPWTPEIGAKMSASRSGSKNPMYGRSGVQNPMFGKQHRATSLQKISEGVKQAHAIKGPVQITETTRQRQIDSKTKQFANIVPLHTRVCELRSQNMKYKDIAVVIAQEFGLVRPRQHYQTMYSDHKLQRCRTCVKLGVCKT